MSNKDIKAKVVMDSVNPHGKNRVLTLELQLPKFLDAEFEKHGSIATNSSSSRAIGYPATRNQNQPFIPTDIYSPAKSMHSNEKVDTKTAYMFRGLIDILYETTLDILSSKKDRIHKQHLNRYLEPFTLQTKVATANIEYWEAFLELRLSEFADPNIRDLSEKIKKVIDESEPEKRYHHIPYLIGDEKLLAVKNKWLVSAGRLAKVSYNNINGDDTATCLKRGKMLAENKHWSCFEHQLSAYPMPDNTTSEWLLNQVMTVPYMTHTDGKNLYSGRAKNWLQSRKVFEVKNK